LPNDQATGAMTADLFRLGSHDVHVWSLRLDLSPAVQDRLEGVLSASEAARAGRFVDAASRRRSVAAHGLLRVVLSGYLGRHPGDVALEVGRGGKPRLAEQAGPRFSLSHAGARGLLAVSADREVGVDIERIGAIDDVEGLAEVCFSPVERAALSAVPAAQRGRAFYVGWTRKEAFLMVIGEGLARPLDSFAVTLTPGEPERLLGVRGAPEASRRYTLRALEPAAGYVGAVAVDGPGLTTAWRPWRTLAALLAPAVAPPVACAPGSHPLVGEGEP
jgi:4'-phosphopantetheinyl transferase